MNVVKLLATSAHVVFLFGCGTASVLPPDASRQPSSENSTVVFGLNPNYAIHLVPGEKLPRGFKQGAFVGPIVNGESTDGYLVATLRPGQVVGLVSVFKHQEGNVFGTQAFTACGHRALVLEVPHAGKVYYVTHIEYTAIGDRLGVRYSNRIKDAAEYLHTKYPQLRGEIEQLAFEHLPSLGGCIR